MFFALGAASSAIDLLSSLTSPSSSSTPNGHAGTVPGSSFSITNPITTASAPTSSGGSGGSQLAPSTFNTLLAAQSQSSGPTSRSAALNDLFSQIDSNGDGQITKSEFETALGAGGTNLQMADDVFNKMDLNGDGTVSKDEMARSLEKSGGHHHHHHHAGGAGEANGAGTANGLGGSGGGNADALMQALQGATSTSTTNSDGSTTTTLTYADGTKITMTQPAAGSSSTTSASGKASQSYNFTERLIERQAQLISANATPPLSMSA